MDNNSPRLGRGFLNFRMGRRSARIHVAPSRPNLSELNDHVDMYHPPTRNGTRPNSILTLLKLINEMPSKA